MEVLDVRSLDDIYRGRRVLITGHTGFKGSWLALWLAELGAHPIGISLPPPTEPNHWNLLELDIEEHRVDVRDENAVRRIVAQTRPECVFHLAAQPLVRRSYAKPVETWSTNVMGTVSLLEACRTAGTVRAIVVATTDKCYDNVRFTAAHREDDALGGRDPYSASKAAAELVCGSYRAALMKSGDAPLLATARAGNVIGGGDWSEDRLVPDLVRARSRNESLPVRSPDAVRPWQHVLDCLAGYLLLGARLLAGNREFARAWNFGPKPDEARTVQSLLSGLSAYWPNLRWHVDTLRGVHESPMLLLDSTRARDRLGWHPRWSLDQALEVTALWYREFLSTGKVSSRAQLAQYSTFSASPRVAGT